MNKLKSIAEKKGGKILSENYKSKFSKLELQCNNGHTWKVLAVSISRGDWCAVCKRDEACKKELAKLARIAEKKGGRCLSHRYSRKDVKLQWQCSEGHVWSAEPASIKHGMWCKKCGHQRAAEKMRGTNISEIRQFAKNHGGKMLSEKYLNRHKPMKWQCRQGHIWMANVDSVMRRGSWCRTCRIEEQKPSIQIFQKIAEQRKGKLLSKKYVNSLTPMKWRCPKGHVWQTSPAIIKGGSWCPTCTRDKTKKMLEQYMKLAQARGGELLAKSYVNAETPLKWKCSEGHTWITTPHHIKLGGWCGKCHLANRKNAAYTRLSKIAKKRKGKILSEKYINWNAKLEFECSKGHIWKTKPHTIYAGSWCPSCADEYNRQFLTPRKSKSMK